MDAGFVLGKEEQELEMDYEAISLISRSSFIE